MDEVIKGRTDGDTVTFKYAGGVVDGQGMAVSAMVYPQIGEKGIYFIEQPDAEQVNPMVGWGQGHFVIALDEGGGERVLTEDLRPVLGIEDAPLPRGAAARAAEVEFSEGVARGVEVGDKAADRKRALGKAAFKAALRDRMSPAAAARAQ